MILMIIIINSNSVAFGKFLVSSVKTWRSREIVQGSIRENRTPGTERAQRLPSDIVGLLGERVFLTSRHRLCRAFWQHLWLQFRWMLSNGRPAATTRTGWFDDGDACQCVYMYEHIYIYNYIYMYIYMSVFICIYTYTRICIRARKSTGIFMYVYTSIFWDDPRFPFKAVFPHASSENGVLISPYIWGYLLSVPRGFRNPSQNHVRIPSPQDPTSQGSSGAAPPRPSSSPPRSVQGSAFQLTTRYHYCHCDSASYWTIAIMSL